MEITISGKDKKRIKLVEKLAKELGLSIIKNEAAKTAEKSELSQKERSEKLYQLMEKAAADGGLFQYIDDPVAWQWEQRKDRPLPGRE